MSDLVAVRERYLRDTVPVRLGGLAANLARIHSFSRHEANRDVVERLLNEAKFFIEWTAADTDIDQAAELVTLQLLLARWQYRWTYTWADPNRRVQVAEAARDWSERVLKMSGLLAG
jgi:hypothetical protein